MARTAKPLTLAQIKRLPVGLHAVGGPVPGLCVLVNTTGKAWRLRRYVDGVQRSFEVGDFAEVSLERARELAAALADSLKVDAEAAPRAEHAPARANARERAPARADDNPFLGPIARELLALRAAAKAAL